MLPKPKQDAEHLWVLITKKDPISNEAIMVNITTRRAHSDVTTILNPGDHPFIKRESVVFYCDARMVNPDLLDQAVVTGSARMHEKFTAPILYRIQQGVSASNLTPRKIKSAFAAAVAADLIKSDDDQEQ